MAYEIDNNVVFNAAKKSRHSKVMELPFDKLIVGQSFHVPNTDKEEASKLSAWCQLAGKKLEKRFSLRTVGNDDPRGPGVRIWRVEDKPQNLDKLFADQGQAKASTKAQTRKVEPAKPNRRQAKAQAKPASRSRTKGEPRSFQPGA